MNKLELKYHPYELKLSAPFETSKGKITTRKGFIISLESSSGKIGIGDVCPLPDFGSETYEEAEMRIGNLKIELKVEIEDFKNSLKYFLIDHNSYPALKHGLEQAIINLICSEKRTSVSQLLNLKLKREIKVNAAMGFLKPKKAASRALQFVNEGFKTIKVKIGRNNFDEDLDVIASIRKAVGDEIKLRIDSNGKWSVDEAETKLNRLMEFSLEYAEQPVNSIDEFKVLKEKTSIPVAADESIRNIETAESFLESKAINFIILKPMMLGGLIPTLEIIELAEKNSVIPVVTSSFESAVGRANAVIAASTVKSDIAHGLSVSRYFENDIAEDKYPVANGNIKVF